jgi:hypothetical protein
MTWTGAIPYFTAAELGCRGYAQGRCGCGGEIRIHPHFAARLPALRAAWGKPLTPTSVCRCPAHNGHPETKGHPRSLHLTRDNPHGIHGTAAADLGWRGWDPATQLELANTAWRQGFAVGLHDGFLHIDDRGLIGHNPTVFLYGAWSGPFTPQDVLYGFMGRG